MRFFLKRGNTYFFLNRFLSRALSLSLLTSLDIYHLFLFPFNSRVCLITCTHPSPCPRSAPRFISPPLALLRFLTSHCVPGPLSPWEPAWNGWRSYDPAGFSWNFVISFFFFFFLPPHSFSRPIYLFIPPRLTLSTSVRQSAYGFCGLVRARPHMFPCSLPAGCR